MRGALRFGELGDPEISDERLGDADAPYAGAECLPNSERSRGLGGQLGDGCQLWHPSCQGQERMSVAVQSSALRAERNGAFCRFGAVASASVLVLFALSHFAAAAVPPMTSKEHHARRAQSKDQQAPPPRAKEHSKPVQSRAGPRAPAQSLDRHIQRHSNPAKSKDHQAKAPHSRHPAGPRHVLHGPDFNPPYADILIDDNSGQVLHETDPDSPRHPASLTKIMTLYLLFEQLEAKKLTLDTRLQVSTHASTQAPTKLGLKPNETITVEDAIKAVVTRSANDAAVVIAEAIGGSEADFALLMTRKAQMLGMANTVYVNASGLPADPQITTAREQALLGRSMQERFPEYSRYFAIPSFHYHGIEISNHNALLREMRGVDGIKTGYTEASGYNLVASMRRDGRHLIGVVLGEKSNGARNARMRQLLEEHLSQASSRRMVPTTIIETTASP